MSPVSVVFIGDVVDRTNDDRRRCDMAQARKHDGGYGRRWKKWLAIYVIAGVLIYGLIYLILQSGGGSGGGLYG
jgi:hypothetical protein